MIQMTDILFINPLGWDNIIWARVTEQIPNKTFDFIEFTEESFKSISKKEIEQVLLNKMTRVKRGGYIVALLMVRLFCLMGWKFLVNTLMGLILLSSRG